MNEPASRNLDLALLGLRIGLGVLFILAGWGKVSHVAGVVGLWQRLHLPLPHVFGPIHAVVEFGARHPADSGFIHPTRRLPACCGYVRCAVSGKDSHPNFHPAGVAGVLDKHYASSRWRGVAFLGCVS